MSHGVRKLLRGFSHTDGGLQWQHSKVCDSKAKILFDGQPFQECDEPDGRKRVHIAASMKMPNRVSLRVVAQDEMIADPLGNTEVQRHRWRCALT